MQRVKNSENLIYDENENWECVVLKCHVLTADVVCYECAHLITTLIISRSVTC